MDIAPLATEFENMSHIQSKVFNDEDDSGYFDPADVSNRSLSTNGDCGKSEVEMQPLTHKEESEHIEKLLDPTQQENIEQQAKKPWNLQDFLFPPNLPRECQLLRMENLAIPACYLCVGLLQGLSGPLINVYPLDLGATEAQQTTLSSIKSLPAAFKLIFGFVSDNFPILGYRRKSYMLFGWLLASLSMFILMGGSNLSLEEEEYIDSNGERSTRSVAPDDAPSIPFLSLQILLFGTGFWVADVMGDSVVAEKAKLEPPDARGSIQSSCYSYRFFGLMVAAPFSTGMYYKFGPATVIFLMALLPLCILPLVYKFREQKNLEVASTQEQCGEIWKTVCSRSVWQPLGFVYIYNLLQVGNAAWREYLRTTLGFTSEQLNLIYIASVVLLYLGVLTYKYWMMKYSWRLVYGVCTVLNSVFSCLQVLLVKGITFGISDFWFALGDDAFMEFIQGIQFLPTTIMMVRFLHTFSRL